MIVSGCAARLWRLLCFITYPRRGTGWNIKNRDAQIYWHVSTRMRREKFKYDFNDITFTWRLPSENRWLSLLREDDFHAILAIEWMGSSHLFTDSALISEKSAVAARKRVFNYVIFLAAACAISSLLRGFDTLSGATASTDLPADNGSSRNKRKGDVNH